MLTSHVPCVRAGISQDVSADLVSTDLESEGAHDCGPLEHQILSQKGTQINSVIRQQRVNLVIPSLQQMKGFCSQFNQM